MPPHMKPSGVDKRPFSVDDMRRYGELLAAVQSAMVMEEGEKPRRHTAAFIVIRIFGIQVRVRHVICLPH